MILIEIKFTTAKRIELYLRLRFTIYHFGSEIFFLLMINQSSFWLLVLYSPNARYSIHSYFDLERNDKSLHMINVSERSLVNIGDCSAIYIKNIMK